VDDYNAKDAPQHLDGSWMTVSSQKQTLRTLP
jgi:hypothetical protein